MAVLSKDEAERLGRIERGVQYGVTIKDLHFLVRLARKLEAKCEAHSLPSLPFDSAPSPQKARASR